MQYINTLPTCDFTMSVASIMLAICAFGVTNDISSHLGHQVLQTHTVKKKIRLL